MKAQVGSLAFLGVGLLPPPSLEIPLILANASYSNGFDAPRMLAGPAVRRSTQQSVPAKKLLCNNLVLDGIGPTTVLFCFLAPQEFHRGIRDATNGAGAQRFSNG